MPDDDERYDLRIGGWLPPYPGGADPRGDRLPVPYPRLPLHSEPPESHARRVLLACGIVVAAGVTGVMTLLLLPDGDAQSPPIAERMVFPTPPEPSAAVSLIPAAPTSISAAPTTTTRTREVSTALPTTQRPGPTGVTRTVSPAPVVDLVVGTTVGLEVDGMAGFRVRHRNFLGRVDRITAGSSALDRADSRFVVRKGLGRDGCVSLEAVNYPGYFLRHRDFVIHLDRRDRSQLFDQDATFCPEPTQDGGGFILEAINYPSRAVALRRDGSLRLSERGATTFVVRSPL